MAVTTVRIDPPPARVLHPLDGFGAQLNTNIFTKDGHEPPHAEGNLGPLREAIDNLKPGHCRIFVRRGLRPDLPQGRSAPEFVALMNTIKLAQRAGANVNLTWWGQGPYGNERRLRELEWPNRHVRNWPQPNRRKWPQTLTEPNGIIAPRVMMERFAQIIKVARDQGLSCVTHATIQNEVNGESTDIAQQDDPNLSMRFYELLYRRFDEALKNLGLRDAIRIVAGDLLERPRAPAHHQNAWLKYMFANMDVPREGMDSVLDGYSIHVYWEPHEFPQKPETRLKNLERTMRSFPSDKPLYVTEYGVRKLVNPMSLRPGTVDGVKMERSPISAFQHAWFNALAPQYGCVGLAKWALYRTEKPSGWGQWGMIDAPSDGFERFPTYRVTRFFTHFVEPGWRAAGLGRGGPNVLVSKFAGPNGQESIIVLNNRSQPQQIRVEGLRPQGRYFGAEWNRDGDGMFDPLDPVTADGAAETVTVAGHGMVGLSTRPPGL